MEEKRLTIRLQGYWNTVRKSEPLPEFSHFNPGTISDIWPWCFVVTVDGGGESDSEGNHTYKYVYLGDPVINMYGKDLTGQKITSGVKHFLGARIYDKLQQVMDDRQMLDDTGHIVNEQGKMIKYRACFLPFGKTADAITHIVVGLTYRSY